MAVPTELVSYAARTVFATLAEEVRLRASRPTTIDASSVTPVPGPHGPAAPMPAAGPPHTDGCPVCLLGRQASAAVGHLHGLAVVAEREGRIPDVARPVADLARQDLADARDTLDLVRDRAPSLAGRCDEVGRALDQAQAMIPSRDTVTGPLAKQAADFAERAHLAAFDLGVAYFSLKRTSAEGDTLRRWFEESRGLPVDEAMARLKEVLADGG